MLFALSAPLVAAVDLPAELQLAPADLRRQVHRHPAGERELRFERLGFGDFFVGAEDRHLWQVRGEDVVVEPAGETPGQGNGEQ